MKKIVYFISKAIGVLKNICVSLSVFGFIASFLIVVSIKLWVVVDIWTDSRSTVFGHSKEEINFYSHSLSRIFVLGAVIAIGILFIALYLNDTGDRVEEYLKQGTTNNIINILRGIFKISVVAILSVLLVRFLNENMKQVPDYSGSSDYKEIIAHTTNAYLVIYRTESDTKVLIEEMEKIEKLDATDLEKITFMEATKTAVNEQVKLLLLIKGLKVKIIKSIESSDACEHEKIDAIKLVEELHVKTIKYVNYLESVVIITNKKIEHINKSEDLIK